MRFEPNIFAIRLKKCQFMSRIDLVIGSHLIILNKQKPMAWNPETYNKFKTERFAPFLDLVALIKIRLSVQKDHYVGYVLMPPKCLLRWMPPFPPHRREFVSYPYRKCRCAEAVKCRPAAHSAFSIANIWSDWGLWADKRCFHPRL